MVSSVEWTSFRHRGIYRGMDQFQTHWNLASDAPVSEIMVSSVEWTSFRHHLYLAWNGPVSDIMVSSMEWTSFRHRGI